MGKILQKSQEIFDTIDRGRQKKNYEIVKWEGFGQIF